jgi:inhibitor of cysteine peptidase
MIFTIKWKRIIEVKVMKKIFKIIAMLLLVAGVVFMAGCSSKQTNNATQSSVASDNVTASMDSAQVAADNNASDVNVTYDNSTDNNATDVNVTYDNSTVVSVDNNTTDNTTYVSINDNTTS